MKEFDKNPRLRRNHSNYSLMGVSMLSEHGGRYTREEFLEASLEHQQAMTIVKLLCCAVILAGYYIYNQPINFVNTIKMILIFFRVIMGR